MKNSLPILTALCLGALLAPIHAAEPIVGVPHLVITDFNQSAETWWQAHPFNPDSPNYNPVIKSPDPQVKIGDYGNDIQKAIDALGKGGTIHFPAGTYPGRFRIVGKGNLHFIADEPGKVIFTGSGGIYGNETAQHYRDFVPSVRVQQNKADVEAYLNPPARNIYFQGITWDGGNRARSAFDCSAVCDVVWENCTFQNYNAYDDSFHGGLLNGNSGLTNIWLIKCHMVGRTPFVVYWDGIFGGGLIGCTIENGFKRGGPLYLCNDDFTYDANHNGKLEMSERHTAQYAVVYGCTIKSESSSPAGNITGRNCLIAKNKVTVPLRRSLVYFNPKTSLIYKDLAHEYTGNAIIGNSVPEVGRSLVVMDCEGDAVQKGWNNKAILGKYIVKGNQTGPCPKLVQERGTITGPNVVCGNCVNDPACKPDVNCK